MRESLFAGAPTGRLAKTGDNKRRPDTGRPQDPPGNRLEKLYGDREGQYSIRINDQFRVCFEWKDGDAHEVEIVDYHI